MAIVLFAGGCFGLGLATARWLGWVAPQPAPPAMALPPGVTAGPVGAEPQIFLDGGSIVLHDASLTIDPPPPPQVEPR
ncbi:MAG: hypothetical protein R3B70_24385 [Polyangiaceae bacterium]